MTDSVTAMDDTIAPEEFCTEILDRICTDLAMIIDREFSVEKTKVSQAEKRAEGKGKIHISFRIGFNTPDGRMQGCVLIPLPDALTLSAYLMMVPDDGIKTHRNQKSLDGGTKDAMLEVGNFIGGASDAVVRGLYSEGFSVRFEGCQGVRANVRPALEYADGDPLVIAKSKAKIHDLPTFDLIMILPSLPFFE